MPQLFFLIGLAIVALTVVFAGLGWAGRFRYHRDFPKDSWQSTELARAHTIMYLGVAICLAFPLSDNRTAWLVVVGAGVLVELFGLTLLMVYLRKMRKSRQTRSES